MQILSDQKVNFEQSMNKTVNYEDPNLSVQLPVFMIHGNHDDPTRDGACKFTLDFRLFRLFTKGLKIYLYMIAKALSAIDILQDAGLVNYFGALQELENCVVSPILIQKGTARLALYGLGKFGLFFIFSIFSILTNC